MINLSKIPTTQGVEKVGRPLGYILLGLVAYGVVGAIVKHVQVAKNTVYTIGITTKTLRVKGPDSVCYYFYYKGAKYEKEGGFQGEIVVPNGKYFVKFSSKDPDYVIFTSIPVPDCIKEQPFEGWLEIPVCGNKDTSSYIAH